MKKDFIALGLLVLILALVLVCSDIQSVDDYYLTHLDDITPQSRTVFVTIRCDTVLQNSDALDPALRSEEFVPSDGVILARTEYVLRENDTVFTVLERVVRHHRWQMECQRSVSGNSGVYISSLHHLDEFACGPRSGWIFTVNHQTSGKDCASYVLQDKDEIAWLYTCDLGLDLAVYDEP